MKRIERIRINEKLILTEGIDKTSPLSLMANIPKALSECYKSNKYYTTLIKQLKPVQEGFNSNQYQEARMWILEKLEEGYAVYGDPFYEDTRDYGFLAIKKSKYIKESKEEKEYGYIFNVIKEEEVEPKIQQVGNQPFTDALVDKAKANKQRNDHLKMRSLSDDNLNSKEVKLKESMDTETLPIKVSIKGKQGWLCQTDSGKYNVTQDIKKALTVSRDIANNIVRVLIKSGYDGNPDERYAKDDDSGGSQPPAYPPMAPRIRQDTNNRGLITANYKREEKGKPISESNTTKRTCNLNTNPNKNSKDDVVKKAGPKTAKNK